MNDYLIKQYNRFSDLEINYKTRVIELLDYGVSDNLSEKGLMELLNELNEYKVKYNILFNMLNRKYMCEENYLKNFKGGFPKSSFYDYILGRRNSLQDLLRDFKGEIDG